MTYEQLDLFQNAESSQPGSLAKTSAWQVEQRDSLGSDQVCSAKSCGCFPNYVHGGSSLKMSLTCCQSTGEGIWEPLSGRWGNAGTGSLGGYWTLSISESPNVAVACSLSDILEIPGEHLGRFFVSQRGCSFISPQTGAASKKSAGGLELGVISGREQIRLTRTDPVAALTANGVGTCGPDDNQAQAGHLLAVDSCDEIAVRRITPLECERLQGFRDNWTEGHAGAARYKMLGNAVAVPVVEWIAKRLVEVDERTEPGID